MPRSVVGRSVHWLGGILTGCAHDTEVALERDFWVRRGLRHRNDHEPGWRVRCGVPTAGPVVGVRRAQPAGHADQPSLQRAVGSGGADSVRPAGTVARTPGPHLVAGSAPGVIIGAVLRVYVADDPTVFKLLAAAVLAPTGVLILGSTRRGGTRPSGHPSVRGRSLWPRSSWGSSAASTGSGADPSSDRSWSAPAWPSAWWHQPHWPAPSSRPSSASPPSRSCKLNTSGSIGPDWSLGIACGLGGLCGATSARRCTPDARDVAPHDPRPPGPRSCGGLRRPGSRLNARHAA